jgi:hypothetical protein
MSPLDDMVDEGDVGQSEASGDALAYILDVSAQQSPTRVKIIHFIVFW